MSVNGLAFYQFLGQLHQGASQVVQGRHTSLVLGYQGGLRLSHSSGGVRLDVESSQRIQAEQRTAVAQPKVATMDRASFEASFKSFAAPLEASS